MLMSACSILTRFFGVLKKANAECRANLGAKTYLIFAGWMLICLVLTFLYLPETKGRTSAELDEMFAAGVPSRRFKGK